MTAVCDVAGMIAKREAGIALLTDDAAAKQAEHLQSNSYSRPAR